MIFRKAAAVTWCITRANLLADKPMSRSGSLALLSASLLSISIGSVHAFSVFLVPLEDQFGASRAAVSLTYSLALIMITLAVLFGYRLFCLARPPVVILAIGALAVLGAVASAMSPNLPALWLAYGCIFGAANGLGYGFSLQFSARANPGREGLSMGIATAAYALGAVVAPAGFSALLGHFGFSGAMFGLAGSLALAGVLAAAIAAKSGAEYAADAPHRGHPVRSQASATARYWLGYAAGTAAGLMVIGHATGIALAKGYAGATWHAAAVISLANLSGSVLGGRLVDLTKPHRPLIALPILTMLATLGISVSSEPAVLWTGLLLVGFAYGGTIAAYPSVIQKRFGPDGGAAIYARVFTAWGVAGLIAPWAAGAIYDASGGYGPALLAASVFAALSAFVGWRLRDESP